MAQTWCCLLGLLLKQENTLKNIYGANYQGMILMDRKLVKVQLHAHQIILTIYITVNSKKLLFTNRCSFTREVKALQATVEVYSSFFLRLKQINKVMEYKGKLYGKVGEIVFPLLHTTDDWERMENRIKELEALIEQKKLNKPDVGGSVCPACEKLNAPYCSNPWHLQPENFR